MKKLVVFSMVSSTLFIMLYGCATGKGPLDGLFKAQIADEIKLADRVAGIENADMKVADKAEAKAVDLSKTQNTSNRAGGDISTVSTSDPLVLNTVAGGLFGMMGSLIFYMFLTIRQKDKQITKLMEGQQKFIAQQEEGQQKYIEMLEQIAMSVLADKIKKEVA